MLNWLFYTIPERKRIHYGICLWLVMWIIPEYLLKVHFTVVMQFINFITYDILYFQMLKIEAQFKNDDEE
ncbi:hypothetical protein EBU71_01730 [bacterium]|nr:hypothetical protein [Candidatus Elulimicrobium humile]